MPDKLPDRNDFTETVTELIHTTEGSGNRTSIVTYSGTAMLVEHPDHPEDDYYHYPEKQRKVIASGPRGEKITQAESAALFRTAKEDAELVMMQARESRISETAAAFEKRVTALNEPAR